jgi:hypothetical protein
MSDPYTRKLVNRDFYRSKADIKAKVLVVLGGTLENRELHLIQPISRAFSSGTIIELIGTDDRKAAPGTTVDAIAYIGFVEFLTGGVLLAGDQVTCNGKTLGTIAGYDDTHMPNHQNTILAMEKRISGMDLGMKIGDEIIIKGFTK